MRVFKFEESSELAHKQLSFRVAVTRKISVLHYFMSMFTRGGRQAA